MPMIITAGVSRGAAPYPTMGPKRKPKDRNAGAELQPPAFQTKVLVNDLAIHDNHFSADKMRPVATADCKDLTPKQLERIYNAMAQARKNLQTTASFKKLKAAVLNEVPGAK